MYSEVLLMNEKYDKKLGITQDYERAKYDSDKRKREYKEKVFDGKQTYNDPISGEILHKSHTAAKKKYHTKYSSHAAETDHINAIKDVHNKVKHNPFLSDDDFKEIVNCDENYRILSKSQNASKGDKNDFQIIFDTKNNMSIKGRAVMAKEKIAADTVLNTKFTVRTVKNISNKAIDGAVENLSQSAIPLMSEGIEHLVKIANDEENLEDAVFEMGLSTAKTAGKGASEKVGKIVLNHIESELSETKLASFLKSQENNIPVLSKIKNSNVIIQLVQAASVVAESASRLIDGEIDANEFMMEIGDKGATMVAQMIGGEVGAVVGGIIGSAALPVVGSQLGVVAGQIIGTMIATIACSTIIAIRKNIISNLKSLNDYKLQEKAVRKLEKEAVSEMENQRIKFRNIVEMEFKNWDDNIEAGFNQMLSSACEESFNLQGITDGLDRILSVFGKTVAFRSLEEYESQLDMPLKLSF